VQGSAEYIDDMPEPVGTMHIAVGGSPVLLRGCGQPKAAMR
jgi:xanthine dehydrogenase molybdopterin-binding subunit B